MIWVGIECTSGLTTYTDRHGDTYVKQLVIPPGCPSSLEIVAGGWKCGPGTGDVTLRVIRNGIDVYNRETSAPVANCSSSRTPHFWNGFLAGDILKIYVRSNSSFGATVSQPPHPPCARQYNG